MKILKTYPLAIIILLVIGWLSLGTPPSTNISSFTGIDKVAHFCMYFGLTTIIWIEYLKYHCKLDRERLLLFAVAAPILYGGIMEICQAVFTDGREADWLDFVANSIGVIAGTCAGFFILKPAIWKTRR